MKKLLCVFLCVFSVVMTGCDLQPKIASIPDNVGDFISTRYPTLLAEPNSEIYETAVADYGVYASPAVYGNGDITGDDYVLYSSTDDYMMPAQDTYIDENDVGMPDVDDDESDVVMASESSGENKNDAKSEYGFAPDDDVDDLIIPDYKVSDLVVKPKSKPNVDAPRVAAKSSSEKTATKPVSEKTEEKSVPKKTSTNTVADKKSSDANLVRADVREITVQRGDTLYSLSRKYAVPVNDLAVMNKISAPFALSVGQKLKVPDVLSVTAKNTEKKSQSKNNEKPVANKDNAKNATTTTVKKSTAAATLKTTNVKPEKSAVAKSELKADKKSTTVKSDTKKANAKTATQNTNVKTTTKKTNTTKTETKTNTQKNTTQKQSQKTTVQKIAVRSSSKFSWPVRGKILSGYGSKTNGLFNDGINIKASRGATVAAAENGLVAYAGNEVKGMGNLVIIQHSDGWMTVYAHMESMSVRRGHKVSVGQKIGTVGTSGKVDQPQLHFEIRKGTRAYNPINYLKK